MLQSVEVGTLITALGCGIGRDEFDPDKLRYHYIVIMTDADVDGSHIRTLLLTFFYRQMPELIRRGHIYIAQPPLYKVKKGKQERYVKDDAELNAYLLQLALENAQLAVNEGAPGITDTAMEALAHEYMRVTLVFNRLERKLSRDILEAMINFAPLKHEQLSDQKAVHAYGEKLQEVLNESGGQARQFEMETIEQGGLYGVQLNVRIHGNSHQYLLEPSFFKAPDYSAIANLAEKLDGLIDEGATISRGERTEPVESFKDVMDWLIAESKRGLNIQRYKGLGEMNPEQLWETTMDPEARRMLQVNIEDAMVADEVFDTLMGDQVEPRREFIEHNALEVANLDV